MKRNWASELRAIADGRLMLNVRNGVTVSRSMLAMIADEIDALRAAPLTPAEAGGLVERLRLPWPPDGSGDEVTLPVWVIELMSEAATALEAKEAELSSLRIIADSQVVSHRDFNTVRAEKSESDLASERAAHAETKRERDEALKALEPFSKYAGILFELNFNNPDVVARSLSADGNVVSINAEHFFAARRVREGGES